jgi:outer membrane protein assembly factor BamB/tetratricopeptide (TPR) repeat protein
VKILIGYARHLLCYASIVSACLFLGVSGGVADDKKDEKKTEAAQAKTQGKDAAQPAKGAPPAPRPAAPAPGLAPALPAGVMQQLPAQAPGANNDNEYSEGITLATDRNIKKILEAAQELIDEAAKNDSWGEAAGLLQQVLDVKEDVFVPVKRRSADGVEKTHQVSARSEANRMLEAMPAKGREFYELRFGAQAKALLEKAKKEGGYQGLKEIVRRFYFSNAGVEATDMLGTYYLDRGRPHDAALCFKRLLERTKDVSEPLSVFTLYKAALAFRRVGDANYLALADQVWGKLSGRIAREGLQVGGESFALDQLQTEFQRTAPTDTRSPLEWTLFRGDATRTAEGRGSAPFLEANWRHSNIQERIDPATRQTVEAALRIQGGKSDAFVPAFFPIATEGKLIFRNYMGITAVDASTGELLWYSENLGCLDMLLRDSSMKPSVSNWYENYCNSNNHSIIFENTTIGTLSTDNVRVYAVDDLGVPPHPGAQQQWNGGITPPTGKLSNMMQHNSLVAIELDSGKIAWERGDPERDTTGLAGSFFLGPPLPIAGQLYALTEKNSELRLVCLDAAKGDLVWAQTLATARDKLISDVSRRIHAVHLSYAEGIIVCPTNAGALLGFDIFSNSLVWAYPYREKTAPEVANQPPPGMGGFRRRVGGGFVGFDAAPLAQLSGEWKLSAPLIHDGKIVFTAPDGGAIHCLSLKDGNFLWQADRRDDLYLAGVFQGKVVLVGKNSCRALSLADGKTKIWEVETGMPSGQGAASGHFYYLPLRKGEVCKIDMEKGVVAAHSPSPKNEIPGNLLFYAGEVISQNETVVTAYPQVEQKVAQINASLAKNASDPAALAERGELRLYKGDLAGAVADLRGALGNHPPAAILAKSKTKLYAALTELLKQDFNTAEQYLDQYKQLCVLPVPGDATAEEKQKIETEQRHRQAGLLCLVARGREKQGRLVEAFQAYLDFGALAEAHERISVINEPTVMVQPDVWAQGRISELVAKATPAQKEPLEKEIAKRWSAVKASKNLDDLRHFVGAFGSLFAVGREARLHLAERLIKEHALLEAELHLLQLRGQQDDPVVAARAVETLARMMTDRGMLDEAVYYYRLLGTEFARVTVRDGKTGAEYLKALSTDKRFWPYLDDTQSPFRGVNLKVLEVEGPSYLMQTMYPLEFRGPVTPFMKQYRLAWRTAPVNNGMTSYHLKLVDRNTDNEVWSMATPPTRISYNHGGDRGASWPCFMTGHLAVVCLGHMVYGLDLAERKKLWEYDLFNPDRHPLDGQMQPLLSLTSTGVLEISNPRGTTDRLGQIGAVCASFVCLKTADGLQGLDPVTGNVLWTRSDLSSRTQIFGDERTVYLVDVRSDSQGGSSRAIRGSDGASVEVPEFHSAFQQRPRIFGHHLVVNEFDPTGALVLRLYDVPTGKDLWKKTLSPQTIVLKTEDPALLSYLDPKGNATVVDLRLPKEVFQASVAEGHADKVNGGLLLEDTGQYFFVLNKPSEHQAPGVGSANSNLGYMRSAPVNGVVYAFDKQSGQRDWWVQVSSQALLLEQFQQLPMLLFSSIYKVPAGGPGSVATVTATLSIDKRTGKRLWDRRDEPTQPPLGRTSFHTLQIDAKSGTIDLIATKYCLRHMIDDGTNRRPAGDVRPEKDEENFDTRKTIARPR